MSIDLSTTGIAKAYLGSNELSKIYLGTNEIYSAEEIVYTNLLSNGQFSTSTAGWSIYGGTTVTGGISAGTIKVTTTANRGFYQTITPDKSKTYYFCGKINWESGGMAYLRMFPDSSYISSFKTIATRTTSGWLFASGIITPTDMSSVVSSMSAYLRCDNAVAYFDDVALIDLTNVAEANRTTTWCDENIYPNIVW